MLSISPSYTVRSPQFVETSTENAPRESLRTETLADDFLQWSRGMGLSRHVTSDVEFEKIPHWQWAARGDAKIMRWKTERDNRVDSPAVHLPYPRQWRTKASLSLLAMSLSSAPDRWQFAPVTANRQWTTWNQSNLNCTFLMFSNWKLLLRATSWTRRKCEGALRPAMCLHISIFDHEVSYFWWPQEPWLHNYSKPKNNSNNLAKTKGIKLTNSEAFFQKANRNTRIFLRCDDGPPPPTTHARKRAQREAAISNRLCFEAWNLPCTGNRPSNRAT